MFYKKIGLMGLLCWACGAWGQAADFVTLGGMPKPFFRQPLPSSVGGFSQSQIISLPNLGGMADNSDFSCQRVYRNATATNVIVVIKAGPGAGRFVQLYVKLRPENTHWQALAYASASGTTETHIPPGAYYCPSANEGGQFFVTALQDNLNMELAMQQVVLWADRRMPGYYYIFQPYGACTSEVYLRTYADGRNDYMVRWGRTFERAQGMPTTTPCPVQGSFDN